MQRMAWKHEDKIDGITQAEETAQEEGKKAARKTEKRKRKEREEANKERRKRNEDVVEHEVEEDKGDVEDRNNDIQLPAKKTARYTPKTSAAVFQAEGKTLSNHKATNHDPSQSSIRESSDKAKVCRLTIVASASSEFPCRFMR